MVGVPVLGPTSSPSASPKSVELPENQLHSELFGMKHLGFLEFVSYVQEGPP